MWHVWAVDPDSLEVVSESMFGPKKGVKKVQTSHGAGAPPEGVDPLAPPQMVGLRAIPVEKSYGMMGYELVTDQKEIMDDPDLQVFRDEKAAEKRLFKGAQAPAGCTRVFKMNDVPHRARRLFPSSLVYGYNPQKNKWTQATWVVTDLPVIVTQNPKEVLETIGRFGSLPVLTSDEGEELLKDPMIVRRSKNRMWGLPCVGLRKLTKKGVERKTPGETIRKQKKKWMEDRHCLNPNLHVKLISELKSLLLNIPTGHREVKDWRRTVENKVSFQISSQRLSHRPTADPTWSDVANLAATNAQRVAEFLEGIMRGGGPEEGGEGDLRNPIVYLRKHKKNEVLRVLSLYAPIVKKLYSYPDSDRRLNGYRVSTNSGCFRRLGRALHRLAWEMGERKYPSLDVKDLFEEPLYE